MVTVVKWRRDDRCHQCKEVLDLENQDVELVPYGQFGYWAQHADCAAALAVENLHPDVQPAYQDERPKRYSDVLRVAREQRGQKFYKLNPSGPLTPEERPWEPTPGRAAENDTSWRG